MKENIDHSKRKWLSLGGITLGASLTGLMPSMSFAMLSTNKPKLLHFNNVNTKEKLSIPFSPKEMGINGHNKAINIQKEDLKKLDHLLRDRRTGQVLEMDANLYNTLYSLQHHLNLPVCEVDIICGYRSPKTNRALRRRSKQVASNSYHMTGKAIDFRIKNVPLKKVKDSLVKMKKGGVGYYPRSNFVHIDTGVFRTWRGT